MSYRQHSGTEPPALVLEIVLTFSEMVTYIRYLYFAYS